MASRVVPSSPPSDKETPFGPLVVAYGLLLAAAEARDKTLDWTNLRVSPQPFLRSLKTSFEIWYAWTGDERVLLVFLGWGCLKVTFTTETLYE